MKHIVITIFLLILVVGLTFSGPENTQVSVRVGTQMSSELNNFQIMTSYGARKHNVLGVGLDVILVNGLHSWAPNAGMDLKFWLGPVYLGAGFLTPSSMVGFPEELEDSSPFLMKTGLDVPLFWFGPGQIILTGGVISPWSTLVQTVQNPSLFDVDNLRLEASFGWRYKKR